MAQRMTLTRRILRKAGAANGCLFKTLVRAFPREARRRVVREIVRLSRQGRVVLRFEDSGMPLKLGSQRKDLSHAAA